MLIQVDVKPSSKQRNRIMTHEIIAIETCPHCDHENFYTEDETLSNKFMATCKKCGETIMLCDRCLNSEDNCEQYCDWCISGCFRAKKDYVK